MEEEQFRFEVSSLRSFEHKVPRTVLRSVAVNSRSRLSGLGLTTRAKDAAQEAEKA